MKAKRYIFLMMEGGPSHIDAFDPKPKLDQLHYRNLLGVVSRSPRWKAGVDITSEALLLCEAWRERCDDG